MAMQIATVSSRGMLSGIVEADVAAIIAFQFAENNRGEKGQSSQEEERLMAAGNYFPEGWYENGPK